jgi:hypothetical protein
MVSGGATEEGYLGRVTLLIDGKYVDYVKAQQEFIKHEVENADWSEWVCPDPKNYLMKCCDCGLVHEAEFGVVRYKSETEREDCDIVDDPNLQAVFRMRRSEQWSPNDTAHRVGGLPMAQPEQEPIGYAVPTFDFDNSVIKTVHYAGTVPLYTTPPQRTWVGLTEERIKEIWLKGKDHGDDWSDVLALARAFESELKEKNT